MTVFNARNLGARTVFCESEHCHTDGKGAPMNFSFEAKVWTDSNHTRNDDIWAFRDNKATISMSVMKQTLVGEGTKTETSELGYQNIPVLMQNCPVFTRCVPVFAKNISYRKWTKGTLLVWCKWEPWFGFMFLLPKLISQQSWIWFWLPNGIIE